MLTRWQPLPDMWTEMSRLQDEMNRLFSRWGGNGPRRLAQDVYPLLNLWEDDQHVYVEAELPGLDLDSLEIFVHGGNQLSLKGQRKEPVDRKGVWHRRERGYGPFSRVFELPYDVDADRVQAELKNGVLLLTLPKREELKPRRIEVHAG